MRLARRGAIAVIASVALAGWASPTEGAVTIGQLASPTPSTSSCGAAAPFDLLQPTVTSGASFVVPATVADGRLTSWSHNAGPGANQMIALKIFRSTPTPNNFRAVAHDGPRPIAPSGLNTFTGVSLPVKAGDILGMNDGTVAVACLFSVAGESHREGMSDLADGQEGPFFSTPNFRLNITATIEPTNTFSFGTTTRDKKKGTAIQELVVPNPGVVAVIGTGVTGTAAAATSVTVTAPGTVKLTIRAQGKKKRKLNTKGKVRVTPTITYTPTGGTAVTQTRTLKLKKKLAR